MSSSEDMSKSFTRFKIVGKVIYILLILTMFAVGTGFIFGGQLYSRISSVELPPSVWYYSEGNRTSIAISMEVEIWNPSILPRVERTPCVSFDHWPCLDATFTNLKGETIHLVINNIADQTGDEYLSLIGAGCLTAMGTQVINPGINIDYTGCSMSFKDANLTSLPLGVYQIWYKTDLMFGKEMVSNGVTIDVYENETLDTISLPNIKSVLYHI